MVPGALYRSWSLGELFASSLGDLLVILLHKFATLPANPLFSFYDYSVYFTISINTVSYPIVPFKDI